MQTHKLCLEKGDEHDTTARANKAYRAQWCGGAERAVPTAAESVARCVDVSRHPMKSGFDANSQQEVLSPCCALLHDVLSARKHANLQKRVTCMIFTMNCKIAVWANKRVVAKCNMALETLVATTTDQHALHQPHVNKQRVFRDRQ